MGKKDKQPVGEVTMAMWCAMIGSIVDVMTEAEVEPALIHSFLDRLDDATCHMLRGGARRFVAEMLAVVRQAVPAND